MTLNGTADGNRTRDLRVESPVTLTNRVHGGLNFRALAETRTPFSRLRGERVTRYASRA